MLRQSKPGFFLFSREAYLVPEFFALAAVVHRLGMLAKRQHDAPLVRKDTASRRIAASGAMRLSFCQQALPSALAQPS